MSEKLLRKFEKALDEHHRTFEICNQATGAELYALLAAYDSMLLPYLFASASLKDSPGTTLRFKTIDDSLSYCLRWLFEEKPTHLVSTSRHEVIESAGQLLLFGGDYTDVADMHMMYGRNLAEVEIDGPQKKIRFKLADEDTDRKEIHGYLETYEFQKRIVEKNQRKNLPLAMGCIKAITQINIKYQDGRIDINDISQLNQPEIKNLVEKELRPEILPLDESVDIVGFSFGDYKRFWLALSNWSNCLLFLYLMSIQNGIEQEKCMPTQLLHEKDFISKMQVLSELSEQSIVAITDRLTCDQRNKKTEILLQPFIRLDNKILWSPLLIRKSRYERNILKLMSRTPELKRISDNIIGGRERKFLNLLGSKLSQRYGYQFKLNTDISNQNQHGEIDFLAYQTKSPTEILIVEAKTILAVDETNEISDATNKLIDAQKQIRQAIVILKSLDKQKREELFKFVKWDKVTDYYPIVMTPESHPNTLYNDDIVPHISYTSLQTFAKLRDFARPSRMWSFCKEKDWIEKKTSGKSQGYKDIKIGDITYSLPYIEIAR